MNTIDDLWNQSYRNRKLSVASTLSNRRQSVPTAKSLRACAVLSYTADAEHLKQLTCVLPVGDHAPGDMQGPHREKVLMKSWCSQTHFRQGGAGGFPPWGLSARGLWRAILAFNILSL